MKIGVFMLAFAAIGSILLIISHAAPNGCSTTGVLGTVTNNISVPETATYKVWVRMQVPDTTNTGNVNGVRLELAGSSTQCFTVTTTASNAVNAWQWVNTDATAASTPHVTASMTSGTYTSKILGLKAGVKVDKVILLKSDSTCVPSNDFTNGEPGDNCTTAAPTVSLTADNASVTSGGSTTLRWSTTNATTCTGTDGWTGTKNVPSGTASTGALTTAKTYTLTCVGPGGTSSPSSVTVSVTSPAPTVTISANPTTVTSGNASTLTWTVANATSCTASGSWSGAKTASGTTSASTGNLTATSTFSLSCTGAGGTTNASTTVTVSPATTDTTPPTVTMAMPGVTVPAGATSVKVGNMKSVTWSPLASDTSGIKTLTLTVNGTAVTLTGGSYVFGGQAGGNGDYLLKAVAVDNANNTTTSQITIRLRHPDFDRSGVVNIFDLSPLLSKWGTTTNPGYDLNVDNTISIFDLSILLASWNSTN